MDRKRERNYLMAHFAELDNKNVVTRVIVVNNNELLDGEQTEVEQLGIDFCVAHYGGTWIQTSFNASFRKNYAGISYTYDPDRDAFIAPKPDNATGFNEETCQWIVPVLK